jgi:hypothetical protein
MLRRESMKSPLGNRWTSSAGKQSWSWQQRWGYQECAKAIDEYSAIEAHALNSL